MWPEVNEKLHAAVAKRIFKSKGCKTGVPGHFWKSGHGNMA